MYQYDYNERIEWQLLITLVTKPFGGRVQCLSGYIYTNTNMEPLLTYTTLYHCNSSLLGHTTWTVHMYGWWKLYFGSSSSSACNWEGREILCLQTVHQMLSHPWLFKMKPSRLLSICQCGSKCNGKDATVCRSALHLGVHVVHSDSRFRSGKQGSYLVHQVWRRSRGKAVKNVNFSIFAPNRWHCHPVAMPSVENLNELFHLDSVG